MLPLYISTTYYQIFNTNINEALKGLNDLDINGIELGSTHRFDANFKEIVKSNINPNYNYLTHNYCLPSRDELIINIASLDSAVRNKGILKIFECLEFSKEINSKFYTFHPGFLADTLKTCFDESKKNYDFHFGSTIYNKVEATNIMYSSLEKILNYAEKLNIKIAIETEGSLSKSQILLMQSPKEFEELFIRFGKSISVNFNIAHSTLASKALCFNVQELLDVISKHLIAFEISHSNLINDEHLPLQEDSFIWSFLKKNKYEVPHILEFRNATIEDLEKSINLFKQRINC